MKKIILASLLMLFFLPLVSKAYTMVPLTDLSAKFVADDKKDNTGSNIKVNGDFNNDGYSDILVSAKRNETGAYRGGAVYLIYGQSTPFSGTNSMANVSAKFYSDIASAFAGSSISAGDINGDGYSDIFIYSSTGDYGLEGGANIYVFYGRAAAITGEINLNTADSILQIGGLGENQIADYMSMGGDLNNDGFDDLVIKNDNGLSIIYGRSTLFTGTISVNTMADATLDLGDGLINGYVQSPLTTEFDLNNDSINDIIFSYMITNDDLTLRDYKVGVVYGQSDVFCGNYNLLTEMDAFFSSSQTGDYYGKSFSVGDVNGDGYHDFIIGADGRQAASYSEEGKAYLYYGSISEWTGEIIASSANSLFTGISAGNQFGYAVAINGDIDHDGYDDILISAPHSYDLQYPYLGLTFMILGRAAPISGSINAIYSNVIFSHAGSYMLLSGGDFNGDGYSDLVLSNNNDFGENEKWGKVYIGYLSIDQNNNGVIDAESLIDSRHISRIIQPIENVQAAARGDIMINYRNGSDKRVNIFSEKTKVRTLVKPYNDDEIDNYLVLAARGNKLAMVSALNRAVVDKISLFSDKKFTNSTLKLSDNFNDYCAVIVSSNSTQAAISIVAIGADNHYTIKKQLVINDANIDPDKFKLERDEINEHAINYIVLKNSADGILYRYEVEDNYDLIPQ